MRKPEVLAYLAARCGISETGVDSILRELADLAVSETNARNVFEIPGIGVMVKAVREERVGRDPQTGEDILIHARTSVKFRVDSDINAKCGATGFAGSKEAEELAARWRASRSAKDLGDLYNLYIDHQGGKPIRLLLDMLGPWDHHNFNVYLFYTVAGKDGEGHCLGLQEDERGNLESCWFK
jgi:nucleoid DNA-binding protein